MSLLKRDDPEYAAAAWAYYARLLPAAPLTTLAAMQAVLDTLADTQPQARTTRPEDLMDLRLVQQLIASGYVEHVTRQ